MFKNKSLFVLFITIFIDLLGFGIVIPILPNLAKDMGATDFMVGVIAAVYSLMNFLFAPLWGGLSDRYGRRPVILISLGITMLSYFMFAFAGSLLMLFVTRALSGIGSANISSAQAYVSDITLPQDRAKNMGLIGAAFGLGFIFGPPAGGLLKSVSTPGTVDMLGFAVTALCLVNLIMAFFMLPESLKEKNKERKFELIPVKSFMKAFATPKVRELFYFMFLFVVAFSMMQITAAILWKEHDGLDEKHIGYVFSFMGICSAVVQGGLVGIMSKRFGENKLLFYGNFLMAAGLIGIPLVTPEYFIPFEFVCIAFIALANGALTPSISSLLSQIAAPHEQGRLLGLIQSFGSLGRVVGPMLGGFLYGQNFRWPYFAGAAVMMACAFLAYLFNNSDKRSHKPETVYETATKV